MDRGDPSFKPIQMGRANFLIWRIENFELSLVPKDEHGTFYNEDAYLIYASQTDRGSSYIHFWLGEKCSQDEMAVAAYKAVECDDYVGGAAVQMRELQNHESAQFLSYFRQGIRYKDGGVASGFHHVERDKFEKKLYRVKGKRYPRSSQMPVAWESFNDGDCFILDLGNFIFVWNGQEARRSERLKAMELARMFNDERKSASVVVLDSGTEADDLGGSEREAWEKELPLSKRTVKPSNDGGDDGNLEKKLVSSVRLYKCSDAGGTLTVTEAASGPLSYEMLEPDDVFLVDNAEGGVWVWVGRNASKTERRESMKNALNFSSKKGYGVQVPVTRVVQGGEPPEFRLLFRDWPRPQYSGKVHTSGRIAQSVQMQFDVVSMHSNPKLASECKMVDDGSGLRQIWRIEDFEMFGVEERMHGQFYGGDCYVIHYTYTMGTTESNIIYFWLGGKSTADEQGTAALKAVEMDDRLGGSAVQIRVVQGREPNHFLAMFEGKMIVYDGGKSGWSKEEKDRVIGDCFLLRVHGTTTLNTKATQVALRAASLNSNDCFVLKTKTAVYIWCGKGCTGDEREMAKRTAKSLTSREPVIMIEGSEVEEFWTLLGGQEDYARSIRLQQEEPEHPVRLFHCSNARGYYWVEEVPNFIQDDLNTEDVLLLDTWDQLFIWIGDGANQVEKTTALETALEYIKKDPSGRQSDDVSFIKVKQGFEPPTFTGFFPNWDPARWSNNKTYEDLKKEFNDMNIGVTVIDPVELTNGDSRTDHHNGLKYSYEELSNGCPDGVKPESKELYLREDQFTEVFGMPYKDFLALPQWKQQLKKKNANLF